MSDGAAELGGRIEAVLWDIDGTLVDSEPLHGEALARVCRSHGFALTEADISLMHGRSMTFVWSHLVDTYGLVLSEDELRDLATDTYLALVDRLQSRQGILELVAELDRRGIRQAAVSNAGRRVVEANLRAFGLDRLFAFALAVEDVRRPKPAPDPYLQAAERLGVDPASCLVVEDSPAGARSARAAGMLVVGWPQVTPHGIEDAHAVVEDLGAYILNHERLRLV